MVKLSGASLQSCSAPLITFSLSLQVFPSLFLYFYFYLYFYLYLSLASSIIGYSASADAPNRHNDYELIPLPCERVQQWSYRLIGVCRIRERQDFEWGIRQRNRKRKQRGGGGGALGNFGREGISGSYRSEINENFSLGVGRREYNEGEK